MPPLLYCLVATPILVLAATVHPTVAAPDAGPATIIVIRHAERADDDPNDPSLSAAGQARARALVDVLEHAGVTAVYCTQYRRTCATAEPLAQHLGIQVSARTAGAGTVAEDARALARDIVANHPGRTVLIVGHSNTVPEIVKALSGRPVPPIGDDEFHHLFVVVVPPEESAVLVKTRYGSAP